MLPVAAGVFCAVLISLPAWLLMAHAIPKDAPSVLKAWGLGFGIKVLLGGAGIWAVVRVVDIPVRPFLWALLAGYMVFLAAEIWWATRRIRHFYSARETPPGTSP